jgi:hypothetical protein
MDKKPQVESLYFKNSDQLFQHAGSFHPRASKRTKGIIPYRWPLFGDRKKQRVGQTDPMRLKGVSVV